MPLALATFNVKDLLEANASESKLDSVARVVRACDADVVALQEVGSRDLVRAVFDRVGPGWSEPVLGTADARGIRCAIASRLPVVESRVHVADSIPFPTFAAGDVPPFGARIPLRRGLPHARIDAPGIGVVDVLAAHLKSRRAVPMRDASDAPIAPTTAREHAEGQLRSLVWRAAEALYLRGLVDEVVGRDARARVAVCGDMNDVADSPVLRALAGAGEAALVDCTACIDPALRYSCIHSGVRAQIDHVLATAPLAARLLTARFLNADLRDHGDQACGGGGANAALAIDSDHAALVVRFG